MKIDRSSPVPLHHQFKQLMLQKIAAWSPGDMIPSEQEFQSQYGLSRTTVRQALGDLVNDGYLVRQRGRGTQVAARRKIAYDPSTSVELNDFMRQQGVQLGWRLQDRDEVSATAEVAGALGIGTGAKVLRIRRLRLADDLVIGYHHAHVPVTLVAEADFQTLEAGGSLDYLMQLPQMRAPKIRRTLEARSATPAEARLLQTRPGAPLLHLERIVTGSDGLPIEYLRAAFCGDRFKYQISL